MTVRREINELTDSMEKTIKLFKRVYNGEESLMKELEQSVSDLKSDLGIVLRNLKQI